MADEIMILDTFYKGYYTYMSRTNSFPMLVHYRGEEHLTIVKKPSELVDGIPFTVIETQIE